MENLLVLVACVVVSFLVLVLLVDMAYNIICYLIGEAYEHRIIIVIAILVLLFINGYYIISLTLALLLLLYKLIFKAFGSESATDVKEQYVAITKTNVSRIPLIGSFLLGYWLASERSKENLDDNSHTQDTHHEEEHCEDGSTTSESSNYDEEGDYSPSEFEYYGGDD